MDGGGKRERRQRRVPEEQAERGRRIRRMRGERRTEKPADSRPYIRDVSRASEGVVDAATVTIGMVLLALAVLFLCFPMSGVLWMGLAAIVGATLPVPRAILSK